MQGGYAAGVQVTVNVNLDSNKGLKAVEFSGGVQQVKHVCAFKCQGPQCCEQPSNKQQIRMLLQDSLLRSVLKGLVWRVFSTALTVSIILVVFHDTVQVDMQFVDPFGSVCFACQYFMQQQQTKSFLSAALSHADKRSDTSDAALDSSLIQKSCDCYLQMEQALKIGGLEFVLKFLVYFAHERLWVQIGDNIN